MFIDSHCHPYMLDLKAYDDFDHFMQETTASGVDALLTVAVDMTSSETCIALAEKYEAVFASVGSHPSHEEEESLTVEHLVGLSDHPKVIAIGETGLDYFYNKTGHEQMQDRFKTHIIAAKVLKKPLIIHTRDAREDTIKIMQKMGASEARGVMHCFTESLEMAQAAIALGFYISFSGIVTFKNAKELQAVAEAVPLDRILIETDAPYLAPVPFRGKQNEPSYVKYVAEKIAELKGETLETVAKVTSQNFCELFHVNMPTGF